MPKVSALAIAPPSPRERLSASVWLFSLLCKECLSAEFRILVACVENLWRAESTAASKSWNPHGKFPFKVAESAVRRWPSRAPPSLLHLKCQRGQINKNKKIKEWGPFLCNGLLPFYI